MDIKPVQPQQQNQNNYAQQPQGNYAAPQNTYNQPQSNAQPQNNPPMSPSGHVKNSHKFVFGYIGLVVLALAVAGVYYWQHSIVSKDASTISSQQSTINTLTGKNTGLTEENAKLKEQSMSNATSTTPASTTTSLAIPSLGITINNIPKDLIGLNDNFTAATSTEVFSTAALTTADSKCSAANGIGIGTIVKIPGTYTAGTTTLKTGQTFVKQLTGSYIVSTKPSGTCSTVTATNTLQTAQSVLLQTLLATPANITAS